MRKEAFNLSAAQPFWERFFFFGGGGGGGGRRLYKPVKNNTFG